MTTCYPVIIERESNGAFSAWVAGLPGVYAAADTAAAAKRVIRSATISHLDKLGELETPGVAPKPQVDVLVLRYDTLARTRSDRLRYVEMDALVKSSSRAVKTAGS